MKKTIYLNDFISAFEEFGRGEQFTTEGLTALFKYFTEYEKETEQQIELDVIAICTEYTQYSSFEEFQESYTEVKNIEELHNNFVVIALSEGFIIQN